MADPTKPSITDSLERGRSWLITEPRQGFGEIQRTPQERSSLMQRTPQDSPESIVRCIDIDRLCEEERIRRLGERIRRDRDEACELSRERRARGLSRELLASGFGRNKDALGDSGATRSGKPQPASRVLQVERTQQQDTLAREPKAVSSPAPAVQTSTAAATTAGFGVNWAAALAEEDFGMPSPTTTSSLSKAPTTQTASTSSWAATLAEENFGVPSPTTASFSSKASRSIATTSSGYSSKGMFGAPPPASSSPTSVSKVSRPTSAPRSVPIAKSTSPSAASRLRKPQATSPKRTSPRARSPALQAPHDLAIPVRPEEVQEQQRLLEETQREMREIKAMESQIGWEMLREEKSQVKTEKKEAETDIMEWRNQLATGLKEIAEVKAHEQKVEDLKESKQFQEFKRDRKQVDKEEELQVIKEQYQADLEFSQMQAEIAKTSGLDRHAMNLEHLEDIEVLRENKTQERIQEKSDVEKERAIEQRLNFNHQATQLRSQKEELLKNLQMLRSVQKQPVCTSGRAGRPRAANGGIR